MLLKPSRLVLTYWQILRHNNEDADSTATLNEIRKLTNLFMSAGGEESSSVISSVMFYLLQNPRTMKAVVKELRQTFSTSEEIYADDREHLPLFNAVIQETLRIHPPGSNHFARRTTKDTVIDGHVIPTNVRLPFLAY